MTSLFPPSLEQNPFRDDAFAGQDSAAQGDSAAEQPAGPGRPANSDLPVDSDLPAKSPSSDHVPDPVIPKSTTPRYYLNTRITTIERAARKDPILRFDAQAIFLPPKTWPADSPRQTSQTTALPSLETSAAPTTKCIVPAVPPSLTAAGAGTEEDERRMRANFQTWLDRVCTNQILIKDDEVMYFIESDFGYSPVVSKSKPTTGLGRRAKKQFAPPPDECIELAKARPVIKQFYLALLENATRLEKTIKTRRHLSLAEGELGSKLAALSSIERHPGMKKHLGKVLQTVGDLHSAQTTGEAATLADPLNYAAADSFIETLTTRHFILKEFLSAQQTARSRSNTAMRLKASTSINPHKAEDALVSLEEAKAAEAALQAKVNRVTDQLMLETHQYKQTSGKLLKTALKDYAKRQIEGERRVLSILENLRPDIRGIDSSGGLGRLGREHIGPRERGKSLSMAQSQGPQGDAWSGIPRVPLDQGEEQEECMVDAKWAASLLSTT
ncbi:Vacuolar protein sorting-associated protein 17 [Neolecta irregularis DAH-3]|uniref:Vacuolar protein sorting-associated protein 17 n=1 Tax=Neolecta irregularis (strain DAH-3) TaxID=1198029 RepID=A0A1U7LNX6_NEOID|nr:Vacuolar protein sorting-associated protein 17 [Neolecta irregularis DAH-3]|eukprot:OLL24293.1 Vacuolar protein sorting-associated protein 17 [Neolecta irregularis DAH-3]